MNMNQIKQNFQKFNTQEKRDFIGIMGKIAELLRSYINDEFSYKVLQERLEDLKRGYN